MYKEQNVFASSKITNEKQKVHAYLRGEEIFPITMEVDLTQKCTRACPGCPYQVSRRAGHTLELPFLDRLFSILGNNTPGLILSGGEATCINHFPETVSLAKQKGFKEIAVISNGGMTHVPGIQDALLENVTSIRFSLYDWQDREEKYFTDTLEKIRNLRNRIEKEGSNLEIGASILTRKEVTHKFHSVGMKAFDAGIHWLYFHPYCIDWDTKSPKQADQTGVLEAIAEMKRAAPAGLNIQVPYERYSTEKLHFDKLHGSHFIIQVGADGINYAGPECKYEEEATLLDLNEYMGDDFLWHPERIEKINNLNSDNYTFIGTKHRPPMFSDYIQKLVDRSANQENDIQSHPDEFFYPYIV